MPETPEVTKEKHALYMRKWWKTRTPEQKATAAKGHNDKYHHYKKLVFDALGNKCATCGFDDVRALQIDHVNGGGQQDRKARGHNSGYSYTFLKKILADPEFHSKYQLLCANHNWIKRHEKKEFNQGPGSKPRKYLVN